MIDIVECPDECASVLRVPIDRIPAPFVFGLQSIVGVVEAMVDDDDIGGVKVLDNASVVTGELPDIESVAVDASFLEPGLIEFFFLSRTHRKGIARMVFDLFIGTEWSNREERCADGVVPARHSKCFAGILRIGTMRGDRRANPKHTLAFKYVL